MRQAFLEQAAIQLRICIAEQRHRRIFIAGGEQIIKQRPQDRAGFLVQGFGRETRDNFVERLLIRKACFTLSKLGSGRYRRSLLDQVAVKESPSEAKLEALAEAEGLEADAVGKLQSLADAI